MEFQKKESEQTTMSEHSASPGNTEQQVQKKSWDDYYQPPMKVVPGDMMFGNQIDNNQLAREPIQMSLGSEDVGFTLPLRDETELIRQDVAHTKSIQMSLTDTPKVQKQESVHQIAAKGVSGGGSKLPYFDKIQKAFSPHDLSSVQAYTGSKAVESCKDIGATAFATGNKVAFATRNPSLHTVAHETTHVIQQREGVQLKGGVGTVGDRYEQQADLVAKITKLAGISIENQELYQAGAAEEALNTQQENK